MIVAIVGGIGSGKTVSAVKRIVDSRYHCFVNLNVDCGHVHRLKKDDIVQEADIPYQVHLKKGTETRYKKGLEVNWDFWESANTRFKRFHIFADEAHNLFSARRSATKWNILCLQWGSQLRKFLSDKEDTHFHLITQRLTRVEVGFRDLLNKIIAVRKFETDVMIPTPVRESGEIVYRLLPWTWFLQYHFDRECCEQDYYDWLIDGKKTYQRRTKFTGNFYYRFYDSYEIVKESAYL